MLSDLKAGVGVLMALIVAACGWRLFQYWPVALGLVVAVILAVLAAKRHFIAAALVAATSSFIAGTMVESTKAAVWLALVAVVLIAAVIIQWAGIIRPGRVDKAWWKLASRSERRYVKELLADWEEVTYFSGLTTADTRRRGLGVWRAHSDRARRADRLDQIAEGDEARRLTPTLKSVTGSNVGYMLEVAPNVGQSDDDWEAKSDHLAKAWGANEVRVQDAGPGLVGLHIVVRTGFDGVTMYPASEPCQLHADSIPFAVDEMGLPVSIRLTESNVLLGGEPGGGKSGGQSAIIAGAAQCANVVLLGIDPKRVELMPWRNRFSELVTTAEEATDLLTRLVEEMERRYDTLELAEMKKFTRFTAEIPLIALFIDELAELLAAAVKKEDKAAEQERATLLRRIVAKGRAAGIVVVMATQKPDAETVPTKIRDLVQQRAAYRTGGRAMTEVIMGAGRAEDALAHRIDPEARGVCYLIAAGSPEPRLVRTLWLPDEDVAGFAAATAHLRPDWTLPPAQD